ncbi:Seipin family [Dillenia turbinata]|uniref:Seipin family n=1 Tax=Dillenia turbinata TaxID=194707 RepID=A0AAN8VQW4_9MAGN
MLTKSLSNGEQEFSTEDEMNWSCNSRICEVCRDDYVMREKEKVSSSSNSVGDISTGSIDELCDISLNFLAFLGVLLFRSIGFQVNLLVCFFTSPIWLSYRSFMLLMFPFQIVSRIRGCLMKKVLRMWSDSCNTITSFVLERLKVQKAMVKLGMRLGFAFVWSSYVFFMLLGLLVSGFVIGGLAMKYMVEEPIQTKETLNFDYTKTRPTAFVPLMSSSSVTCKNSEQNVLAQKAVESRYIPYNHKLSLTVSLTLPESEYNRNLGMFQVRVEFLSTSGRVTASSSYPCMLRYKSQPVRFAETVLKTAPLIAGFQSESQTLEIKMSDFVESMEPTECLKVTLEPRAQFQAGARIPEIYVGTLALESKLPQLKRLIVNWRRTIFIWLSFSTFLTELVFVLIVCRPIIMPRRKAVVASKKKDTRRHAISWYKRD